MLYKSHKSIILACLFMAVSLLSSCASNDTSTSVIDASGSATVDPGPVAKTEVKSVRSQILGSANIVNPDNHSRKTFYLYGAEHLKLDNYYFDFPVVYNKSVKKWMHYFLNRGRGSFKRYTARAGRYAPMMGKILEEAGLPRDLIFLAMAESGFQNKAKSWAKAVGPWQFMPYTGKRYGLKVDWYIDERRDPIKATIAATKYLKKLYNDFGAWELAAAAYNAGEGKIGRAIKRYKTENFWRLRRGRYLKPETKNYIPKIMALAIIGKNLQNFGFDEIVFNEALDFEEVVVRGNTDLIELAKDLGVGFDELHYLNPEVMRWYIPSHIKEYRLRIPVGKTAAWKTLDPSYYQAEFFQNYKLRGNRSRLSDVAKKFKIKKYVMRDLNPTYSSNRILSRGTSVKLPFRVGQDRKEKMYADLYEKPRKSILRKRRYKYRIRLAKKRGKRITNPKEYYTVLRGDSLWSVARKTGTSLDTIIVSNLGLIQRRQIRAGDKLVVR
ncbi:MAG: transglycosylase SLT domain-containing protein [Bacteriovoracaceae bacterium]|nr:transglycosylase SLT domain-containing protein [Bacteriovoracaceae bacterium]